MLISDIIKSTAEFRDQQYVTGKVNVTDVKYSTRSHQLYIYGTVVSAQRKDKGYPLIMVIDKVTYRENPDGDHILTYRTSQGLALYLKQPTENSNVRIRCGCKDYYFSFGYYNKERKTLVGKYKPYIRKTTTYPPRNPKHLPGMCKHILVLLEKLIKAGLVKRSSAIEEYLNRPKKEINY